MAQIVKLRRSSVSGQKPTNSNLQLGELALNTTDGKVYMAVSGSLGPSVEELISTNTVNTGSVNISGSLNLIGNETITGSLYIVSSSLPEIRLENVDHNQNYHLTVGNAGYLNVHDGQGNYVALFGTSSANFINDVFVSGSLYAQDNVTASYFTGSFIGDATDLINVPFHISGSDVSGNTYNKTFTKLQFDDSTGLNVNENDPGTAFISIGSHFKDIFVSGSPILSATGSDAFEIIPLGGVEVYTSITDTNGNGYVKELTISTTDLSSSLNDRMDTITGSIDSLNSFSSSVVLTSQTGSMTVLSASYAVTAAFALNAGGSGGTALGSYNSLVVTSAASTWSFQHDTGQRYPIFQVFDDSGYVVIPSQIQTIDDNNANIIFPSPQTGRVIASLGGGNGTTKEFINSNLWVVDHNLGTDYPDVTVWDSNRNIILPNRIESVDTNQIKIYFSIPVTGHVSVSRGGHILSGSASTISGLISGSSQISNLGFATTGSNSFVGSQTINGCLSINNAKICSTAVTISSNTEIFNLSAFDGAFFDYVVKNGTNMRAGSIMSAWNGTDSTFNETTTMDLGNTNPIGFNVSGTGRLNATISSGTWLVEVLYRALGDGLNTPTPTPSSTPGPTPSPTPSPTATSIQPTPTPTPTLGDTVYMFTYDGTVGGDLNTACSSYPVGSNSACYSYSPTIQIGTTLYSTNTNGVLSNPFVDSNTKLVVDETNIYAVTTSGGTITTIQQCTAPTYTVGQTALGGKIAYILQSGDTGYDVNVQHGLIARSFDINNRQWGCTTEVIGADATGLLSGYQNTLDIISACVDFGDSAAHDCANLVEGGYSDWYLPSKDELNKIYLNKTAIGGFSTNFYWSSTEFSSNSGWVQDFSDGTPTNDEKNSSNNVRPIRSF